MGTKKFDGHSRRDLIRGAALGGGATAMLGGVGFNPLVSAAIATAASYRRVLGANDKIRIALIGSGDRGTYLLGNVRRLEGAEIVGFCDVYEPRRLRAQGDAAHHVAGAVGKSIRRHGREARRRLRHL